MPEQNRGIALDWDFSPGTFFADVTNRSLLAWDSANGDLNKQFVEGSTRSEIFHIEGDYVQARGFRFRYAANRAQEGAVALKGRCDVIEDCVMETMNSQGGSFLGEEQIVRRCVFRDNGQLGFSAKSEKSHLFIHERRPVSYRLLRP